ncbi:MAG: YbaB/EbfC family nucleoid-associated protein [Verrucomicrobiota bacterium]
MSSIGKLMKQAARMQQQVEQIQNDLAKRTIEATSGGGAVKVVVKCDGTIASIKIDPQALNQADAQIVEDMILTAANQALGQAKQISNAEMSKVTAGFSLPGLT